ncbi:MAG: activase [Deltaproteobacteria bacterium]|nr:activase [Deltaproteobacteria bacterium]
MNSIGICMGASTLSIVSLLKSENGRISITGTSVTSHLGNPQKVLTEAVKKLNLSGDSRIAVTGRKFSKSINLTSIPEPEAAENAFSHLNGNETRCNAIVSAGGETFMVYALGKDGKISTVQAGNKCASGTGEFFLQQIGRMGISLEEAGLLAQTEKPYKLSSRCSVFCKSDCTHAMNTGVPKGQIAAGLCRMMAGKILEILKQIPKNNIMITGGCARNSVMISYLKKEIENLVVPDEAPYFEALGCALWALNHKTKPFQGTEKLFKKGKTSFAYLPPLKKSENMVDFKTASRGKVHKGDRCIIGLDAGSTTTKAILLRIKDNKILASVYLRTNGDPVQASRNCYAGLVDQLGDLSDSIHIVGLGVTGSGRKIAGLHAITDGIINEIIAHATGALFFDKEVDTIFEIGGQDAKYTYITNGVASDYAMNEACSAGTGSFLEEAAKETLKIEMEEIADIAILGNNPPNFNDQCAAFIGSDIKNAFNEGIGREDIVAGLVYSICMNYDNRVKGNRPVGEKAFMQGGVCLNRAVPLAMASLTGKHIIVPPDPGLIGAFGVALEIKQRLASGLIEEKEFSLKKLRDREIDYGAPFICDGGKEKCDRKCEIARIKIEGKTFPFGGACNRWYNLRSKIKIDTEELNLVAHYEKRIFDKDLLSPEDSVIHENSKTIGINKSFLVNTYFPLYSTFFSQLGFRVILSDNLEQAGLDRVNAPFCYPGEIAHGFFLNLLEKKPDYVFLPQFKGEYVESADETCVTCPISQSEPFYLNAAFKNHELYKDLKSKGRVLSPVIDFSGEYKPAEPVFAGIAEALGVNKEKAQSAYAKAAEIQDSVFKELEETCSQELKKIEDSEDEFAVVVFGRSYNALVAEGHMGIPNKFASRGIKVIPLSSLPMAETTGVGNMYWSAGQRILRVANFVKKHPQLFGCYITNFSCGPDSFLVGYFRNIMGRKPSLTLELDSHVADAGLETRIEAFIDITKRYRELQKREEIVSDPDNFVPARIVTRNDKQVFVDSTGEEYPISDRRIHLILPSMGRYLSEAGAAVFRGAGIHASALPPSDENALKLGRGNTSCKECLPLLLTVGSLLKYVNERESSNESLIYFIPTTSGPCRFGQYSEFMKGLIKKLRLDNVAVFSLSSENSYAGFGTSNLTTNLWFATIIADTFEEMYSNLLTNAVKRDSAMDILEDQWKRVLGVLETSHTLKQIKEILEMAAKTLKQIPVRRTMAETPTILLSGEIFVRHDDISRQYIIEELAGRGIATKVSTLAEWIYYTDWLVQNNLSIGNHSFKDKLSLSIRSIFMRKYERTVKNILSKSNLCEDKVEDVDHIIKHTRHLVNPELTGEAILTTGTAINEVLDHYCGVIAIGPFGCMPTRVAEAILTVKMNMEGKLSAGPITQRVKELQDDVQELPFLTIEGDGSRFPQIITAKLEAFLMQAERLHEKMLRCS